MIETMISQLKAYFLRELFRPTFAGLFLNPFYFARKELFSRIKANSDYITGVALDIGCGSKPYADLFRTAEYIGIDVKKSGHNHESSQVDLYYDGDNIPFAEGHFDSLVCFEVLELVFEPNKFLEEAFRVLKAGGKAIFTVPFIWEEMEQPYDFARYSSFGLAYLLKKSGFIIIKNEKYVKDLRLLALLTNTYIYKLSRRLIPSWVSFLLILPLTSFINIFGHLLLLFPDNPDFYFGNLFVVEKPNK